MKNYKTIPTWSFYIQLGEKGRDFCKWVSGAKNRDEAIAYLESLDPSERVDLIAYWQTITYNPRTRVYFGVSDFHNIISPANGNGKDITASKAISMLKALHIRD